MAESYPQFEPDSPEGKKKKSNKLESGAPKRVEKLADDTPRKLGDEALRFSPPARELFKPLEQPQKSTAEPLKRPEATEPERIEQSHPTADELRARDIADKQVQFEMVQERQRQDEAVEAGSEKGEAEDEDKKKAKSAAARTSAPTARPEPEIKPSAETVAPQSTESTEPAVAAEQLGTGAENPGKPAGHEGVFQEIAPAAELADAAAQLAEQVPLPHENSVETPVADAAPALSSEPESFDQWLQNHPELQQLASAPEQAAASDDETFNDVVENALDESAPGPAQFHEQEPGEPPIDAGSGNVLPPIPPMPEDGAWGDDGSNPWEQPAGGLGDPATVAGLNALETQRRLDDLHHASREAGLAGAVGLIGLGLVIEHFVAKRRDKKLKRQINKQDKALRQTDKNLQWEQLVNQQTRNRLERMSVATQAANRGSVHERPYGHVPAGAERAGVAPAGIISAAAAAELAAKTGHKVDAAPMNKQELVKRLETDRELGQALKRNPELRDAALVSGVTTEQRKREIQQVAETSAYATVMRREKSYEHLRTQNSDNAGGIHSGGGANTTDAPSLPAPNQSGGNTPALPADQSGNRHDDMQTTGRAKLATSPWAWATLLLVIAAVLVAVYVR